MTRRVRTDTLTFTRGGGNGMLVGEASTLGLPPGGGFEPVYDDACDYGLTLVSHRTGREAVMVVVAERVEDGDLLYWDLQPADAKDNDVPMLRILND